MSVSNLIHIAPHLVRGIPSSPRFMSATAGVRSSSAPQTWVLYDLLSLGKSLPSHRMLTRRAGARELEPGIQRDAARRRFY